MLTSRAPHRHARAALLSLGVVSVLVACSSTPQVKTEKLCTPGAYVFCRCQDRAEGSKLCQEDAESFGPCEPCESLTNPEGPLDPGDPTDPLDGGTNADSGTRRDGSASASFCGNGIVESGEDCDDRNTDDTDGCDSDCKLAGMTPFATNACPGLAVHVWGGAHAPTFVSTTAESGNRSLKPTCGSNSGSTPTTGGGPDRVFKVVAHKTGSMTVTTADANYNVLLYASATCPIDQVEWITCANKVDGAGDETISFPVDSGKTYYVFVDGALPSSLDPALKQGNFRVTFKIP